ncbi:MAG TPA: hypothetical protein VLZ50_05945 [Terracidiphilus sp.]|nr:hypothetical protein [Terracidiphilus sp.]
MLFKKSAPYPIIRLWTGPDGPNKEKKTMHDLLIALAFIGMVIAPAIVAARSGNDATDEMN